MVLGDETPLDLILGEVAATVAFDTNSDSLLFTVSEGRRDEWWWQ